ncbi:hypothetical protein [Helicobacter cetorum]|uniref:hypothetical protein n=1 Tax=Helicobacter cetorum TaxID=138563 RepID=UPI000CF013E5|nr:hypothetical protein [Helicobacter cetorum]
MADLKVRSNMKVKTLRAEFKKAFGATLRVYKGSQFADDEATLASIRKGDVKGGDFSVGGNTKVGNFEDKMLEHFGIKTQVANKDDSKLADNSITLTQAGK